MTGRANLWLDVEPADDGVVVVVVRGEIDVATAPEFEDGLGRAVREARPLGLVVDLTAVTFMDSSGLTALARVVERQRLAGGALAIVTDDSRVRTMFEVARLDRVVRRFSSLDAAIMALGDGGRGT